MSTLITFICVEMCGFGDFNFKPVQPWWLQCMCDDVLNTTVILDCWKCHHDEFGLHSDVTMVTLH